MPTRIRHGLTLFTTPSDREIACTHIVGDLRVAVMTPSGGGLRYLTDDWQDEAPTWSPNGPARARGSAEPGTLRRALLR